MAKMPVECENIDMLQHGCICIFVLDLVYPVHADGNPPNDNIILILDLAFISLECH
jgi:hypothetical protein